MDRQGSEVKLGSDGADLLGTSRSERIRAGIERAKREGTRSGRPFGRPRLSEEVLDAVRQSILDGDSLYQTIKKTGVGMGTVDRLRRELRASVAESVNRRRRPAVAAFSDHTWANAAGCSCRGSSV